MKTTKIFSIREGIDSIPRDPPNWASWAVHWAGYSYSCPWAHRAARQPRQQPSCALSITATAIPANLTLGKSRKTFTRFVVHVGWWERPKRKFLFHEKSRRVSRSKRSNFTASQRANASVTITKRNCATRRQIETCGKTTEYVCVCKVRPGTQQEKKNEPV